MLSERSEHQIARAGQGLATVQDLTQRHATPTAHGSPSLDTIVYSRLFLLGHRFQILQRESARPLHQSPYLQPILGKLIVQQTLVSVVIALGLRIGRDRRVAVGPKIG